MSDDYRDILDEAALEELNDITGGDPEFFAELAYTFLDDAPALMADIRTGLNNGDAGEVQRLAHGLKSNGNDFGAARFANLCMTLEHEAANGNLTNGEALIGNMEDEFSRVHAALEAYINA